MRQVILNSERIKNDINGNPRYAVTLASGRTYNTAAGSSFVYSLPMPVIGEYDVEINGRGTISNIAIIPATTVCRDCGNTLPATTDEEKRKINILYSHDGIPCRVTERWLSQ